MDSAFQSAPDEILYHARLAEILIANDGGIPAEEADAPSDVYESEYDESDNEKRSKTTGELTITTAKVSVVDLSEDPYLSWTSAENIPLHIEEIRDIFDRLGGLFGFQKSSINNMFDHLMVQLDSRASRMSAVRSLLTLHADYIGGQHANYRKWYFASHLNQPGELSTDKSTDKDPWQDEYDALRLDPLQRAEFKWKAKMCQYSHEDMVQQLALYLLIWGEANQVRFTPECLCFIFKCAWDYLEHLKTGGGYNEPAEHQLPEGDFLKRCITPLYNYIRGQQMKKKDGVWVRREKDHDAVIGYDDINQLFWYAKGISRIVLEDGTKLYDLPPHQRFLNVQRVIWDKVFYKTYRERRSWWHLATNFSRIWIIHVSVFWYYYCFNSPVLYTKGYSQRLNNQPSAQAQFSACALAGVLASFIQLMAAISEWAFVPRKWPGANQVLLRALVILLVLLLNLAPSVYIFGFNRLDQQSKIGLILSQIQFGFSIITTLYFSFQPPQGLFSLFRRSGSTADLPHDMFTADFPSLGRSSRMMSISLWTVVFIAKFLESYAFMALSLRDSIMSLAVMEMRCAGEAFYGNFLCRQQARFVLVLMYSTDFILFFLDTYLWYIICNCVLSVILATSTGISMLSPWKNIISCLPQRIYSKLLKTREKDYRPSLLVFQVWNAIVSSMYRDHLISLEQFQRLVFTQTLNEQGEIEVNTPAFFVSQGDTSKSLNYFFSNSEGERRVTFFAQSMSTPIPEPFPVKNLPTFTVLVPHYSEKVIMTLKEIIKEDDNSRISLLEYLKQLYPYEWNCFVEDSKVVASAAPEERELSEKKTNDDLPFYCVGYKTSSSEFTLRTRIWASLRTQTLYRTIAGFMNYHTAIKLLYGVENSELYTTCDEERLNSFLNAFARRKFRMVVSMQKYQSFSAAEKQDIRHLAQVFPYLNIVSLEQENSEGEESKYYSTLYTCTETDKDGMPTMVHRVQLSGDPILGDGKADNQNLSLIYYRGEYIQVIDANQDNYLEECLKIRSVLSEFNGKRTSYDHPYTLGCYWESDPPVAIVGAREYIFSENTGVLGDVAAGKEQTFGTLFSRTLAKIGGKLHYGHPDFLNAIFMVTRGGISKSQRGLHLNEDIYAGMLALLRGGRIKHCDYYQCGKGRDLGFGSILNFTSKIGGGMGEQMLSREYYYLGTGLPLDRFLSFYYAHPGFHLNNRFIMLSLKLFMLVLIMLGALNHEATICIYNKHAHVTAEHQPLGCYNLIPVYNWISRFVISIFICFFISFLPLVIHELCERGLKKALTRFLSHFASLSPLFEVFVCQVYSISLENDLVFGGAKYIATGRGFAVARIPFCDLYATYAHISLSTGSRLCLILIFACLSLRRLPILWFWITIVSMCFSPFIFNPHQFVWTEFFLDYRAFLHWLTRGNSKWHKNSWIGFVKASRSRYTGFKRRKLKESEHMYEVNNRRRAPFTNVLFADVLFPLVDSVIMFFAYTFINAQTGVKDTVLVNSVMRMVILVAAPLVVTTSVLILLFAFSCVLGPIAALCGFRRGATVSAFLAHGVSVVVYVVMFEATWVLEGWSASRTLCALICCISIQRLLCHLVSVLLLTRELKQDSPNRAWWSGQWFNSGLGWLALSQPLREFLVKIVEMSLFAADFTLGHLLLFCLSPLLFIPFVDSWHTSMLFWMKNTKPLRGKIYSVRRTRVRKNRALKYSVLFFSMMILFAALVVVPCVVGHTKLATVLTAPNWYGLVQPKNQNNNDTGSNFVVPKRH